MQVAAESNTVTVSDAAHMVSGCSGVMIEETMKVERVPTDISGN